MRKGEATREQIIRRAATAFNVQGYAGTAMSDIMAATGLEKGGIYRHFTSKDQLALAAFDYAAEQVRQRMQSAQAAHLHPADALIAFVAVFRSYATNPPLPGGCPVLNTAIESDDTHPALRARAQAVVYEWSNLITQLVADGIARQQIRPDVNGTQLALLLIGTMEGAVMLAKLLQQSAPLDQAYEHLVAHISQQVRLD